MTEPLTAERLAAIEADLDAAWTELGETNPIVARAVNGSYVLLSRYQRQSAEVTRLTALITAPDGGGIPLPLLDELQERAAESGCHHRDAIAVAAETAYSVGSEHADDLRAEVKRRGEANTLLATLNTEAHQKLEQARQQARIETARREHVDAQLDAVRQLKVWTNEDGRRFVFADEMQAAVFTAAAVPAAPVPTAAGKRCPSRLADLDGITLYPCVADAGHEGEHWSRHRLHEWEDDEQYDPAVPVVAEATQAEERYCVTSGRAVRLIPGDRCLAHGAATEACTTALRAPECRHPHLSPNHPYPHCSECGRDLPAAPDAVPAAADGQVA